jgi:hypothetical protein
MFHLPREIIQIIFEFDPTYREEYKKSLKIIDELPPYNEYINTHIFPDDIYWFHTYFLGSSRVTYVSSLDLPNEYYFKILRNRKMISIYATSRVKYNRIIRDLKYMHRCKLKLKLSLENLS